MADDRLVGLEEGPEFDEYDGGAKFRTLTGVWRAIVIVVGLIIILLGINTVFNLRFLVDYHLYNFSLYYIVCGLLLSVAYLKYPIKPGLSEPWATRFFWIDVFLFVLIHLSLFFVIKSRLVLYTFSASVGLFSLMKFTYSFHPRLNPNSPER